MDLDVADLAATRFAVSPLGETVLAALLLNNPGWSAVNLPWVHWARAELGERPIGLPTFWPLIMNCRRSWPEWLAPAPATRSPAIGDELAAIRATPRSRIEVSLNLVFGGGEWPQSARELRSRPAQTLAAITGELAEFHDRLIAPHWDRIRSVLDADIAYRATGMLASGGASTMLNDLHPELRWTGGTLTLNTGHDKRTERRAIPGADGLVLVPSVFAWPMAMMKTRTSTQITVRYPARGAATVWQAGPRSLDTTEALLGAPRARLLNLLRSAATPGQLARQLEVTPSAVSQHLAVLYRSGLVDRQRTGRRVLYSTSDLGLTLLNGGCRALFSKELKYGGRPSGTSTIELWPPPGRASSQARPGSPPDGD